MADNWTTAWVKGTGQETQITPVFKTLHISSLEVARHSEGRFHTVNMCDYTNNQPNENHFPVGEIVSYYGNYDANLEKQIENWKQGVLKTVEILKDEQPLIVHCYAGIHRSTLVSSAALTLAYPNEFESLESAHKFVLSKRIIGWKKEDTFRLMETLVEDLRKRF